VAESFATLLPADQGMVGTGLSSMFAATPTPAELSLDLEPGRYLLTWYSEVMRTTAGGTATFFARLRDVTAASTLGFMRHGLGVESGPPGMMPLDSDFFQFGDIFPFSGSTVVDLAGGVQSYRLEYGLSTSGSASEALRARRQRITLTRLE
jgi:hypothetical protein